MEYLALMYEQEDKKCKYSTGEKLLKVKPNIRKYKLTEEALELFSSFHDEIELNILKENNGSTYISGNWKIYLFY